MSNKFENYENIFNKTNLSNLTSHYELIFEYEWWQKLLFATFIFPVTIFTIVGNIFLLIAIIKNKNLHIAGNIFIGSMAVADFSIGLFAMPFNALHVFSGRWYLGAFACRYHKNKNLKSLFLLQLLFEYLKNLTDFKKMNLDSKSSINLIF